MKTQYLLLMGIAVCFIFSPAAIAQSSRVDKKELRENVKTLNDLKIKQDKAHKNFEDQLPIQSAKVNYTFNNIETAFTEMNIENLVTYLGVQTYLNLPNGTNGYYSANQAYFVLEDFLKNYRTTSFKFTDKNTSDINPYATGVFKYNLKGNNNSSHIYVQLRKTSKKWNITQITIN